LCAEGRSTEFDIIVKAANPKRKVTTVVKAAQSFDFQKKLVTTMQSQMFKDMKVAATKEKKKGKKETVEKKQPAKKEEVKESQVAQKARPGVIKKNRKDRRKDQRKERRRDIKKKIKEEKIKLQQETTATASHAMKDE